MPAHSGDPVTAALRQSLSDSCVRIDSLDEKLSVSSTRVLLGHINYEPAGSFESNVLGNLKSKYIVLKNDVQLKKNVSVMSTASSSSSDAKKEDSTLPVPKVTLYPPDRVRPGWSGTYPVGAGMINIGNTCYLNSTLQALFHVPSLVNWLESDSDHLNGCFVSNGSIESECIICAMSKCLKMAQNKSGGVMKPFYIYNKLKSICKHMVHGQQEDAHEFLRYLVESMEKAYLSRYKNVKLDNYSKETTPLNQIFGGYIRTEVNCLQCHGVSTTFQHFQDILLDIRRSSTLDDALSGYFCKERLDGEDAYRCERCHKKVSATKKFSIERPPMVLCIQLKRFSILGGKINKHVSFSQRLDLTRFLCPHSTQVSQKPLVYRLVAMVTHVGSSVHCGHYTAVAQTSSGQFYHFDDSSVRPISLHSALETNAYIIIYEMERNPFKAQSTGAASTSKPATVTSSAVASHLGGHSTNVFKTDSLRQNVPSTVEANNKFGTTTFPVVNGSARSPTKTTSRENSFTSSSSHSNSTGVPVDRKMGLLPPLKDRHKEFVNGKNFHTDAVNGKQYNNRVPETNGEHHWNGSCRSDVADRLHSLSQGTYGADVNTWNGTRNHDDRNDGEDYRESRKREFDRQYDEEFDRGRVKKMKFHDDRDPDYRPKSNVFQDFQRRNNNYRQNRYNKNFIRSNKFFNRNNNRNFRHNNQFRYHRGNGGSNNYHHNNGPNKAPPVACGPRYGSYNNW